MTQIGSITSMPQTHPNDFIENLHIGRFGLPLGTFVVLVVIGVEVFAPLGHVDGIPPAPQRFRQQRTRRGANDRRGSKFASTELV